MFLTYWHVSHSIVAALKYDSIQNRLIVINNRNIF